MDAFEQPFWNLIQVLAWIYGRDRKRVQDAGSESVDHGTYREEATLPDGRREWAETHVRRAPDVHTLLAVGLADGRALPSLHAAEQALIKALGSNTLQAWGRPNDHGDLHLIPATEWSRLRFYYQPPHAAPAGHFKSGTRWYSLTFDRQSVLAHWSDKPDADQYRTGGPGRPSIKHLIRQEFERRLQDNEVLPSLDKEADALSEWAKNQHPKAPSAAIGTIKNNIRAAHRRRFPQN